MLPNIKNTFCHNLIQQAPRALGLFLIRVLKDLINWAGIGIWIQLEYPSAWPCWTCLLGSLNLWSQSLLDCAHPPHRAIDLHNASQVKECAIALDCKKERKNFLVINCWWFYVHCSKQERNHRKSFIMWSGCNHKNTTLSFMEYYMKIFIFHAYI